MWQFGHQIAVTTQRWRKGIDGNEKDVGLGHSQVGDGEVRAYDCEEDSYGDGASSRLGNAAARKRIPTGLWRLSQLKRSQNVVVQPHAVEAVGHALGNQDAGDDRFLEIAAVDNRHLTSPFSMVVDE